MTTAQVPAVEVTGLTKVFEKGRRTIWQRLRREPDKREQFVAVNGIDLRVERGEIFGVLGPNGAGKTTTLRIMVTSGGKSKVNIAIPLGIARMGKTKIAASGLVREQLAQFGIDLDDVLRHISHSGPIVDISDGDDRVLIVVE